jgi:hypothetical protein
MPLRRYAVPPLRRCAVAPLRLYAVVPLHHSTLIYFRSKLKIMTYVMFFDGVLLLF